ncbi:acetyl-CoA carboxylase, biotin carboxyl carrier protein [Sphingomonas sp. SUN019]|uniref:acetyl-CoA carboxylase biotin carboxyl carrier protein n=1 Tax=Sphingomonas sp. SUN019 TaxID=2937788 RepID=UPI002164A6F9|nr:biotin/lipoyl-containing protein [Sphingomonas sp. SUN019]UVO52009.1 acetyl-CoA carboxylase, biotin carboxyl carrier protein [Sphingomonas sp. SUN019]
MSDTVRTDDIAALLQQFRASDLTELHLKTEGFELFVSNDPAAAAPQSGTAAKPAQTAPKPPAVSPTAEPAAAEIPEGFDVVRAPYLGHFYRAPKPGEPNFCEVGDTVEPGAELCLVEVMKLFTAVRAETRGVVRNVYAVDGQMVVEGQPLFALEPAR